jgi:hypothetical protein
VIEKVSLPPEIAESLLRGGRNLRYFARAVHLAGNGRVLR